MDESVIRLLRDKPIIVPRILLNNYRMLGITDTELVVVMLIMSIGDKVVYNPEEFSRELNMDKHETMIIINTLIEKNILSLVVEKRNNKACEYLSLDMLYDKLFSIVIGKEEDENASDSVFTMFESELGRTLSPMEYEKIKEWISNGTNEELIECALREAVMNGVGNFSYIDSILNSWKKKGYRGKNDVMKDKSEFHNKNNKKSVYETDWLNE